MRRLLACGLCLTLCLASSSPLLSDEGRPVWCREGYVCLKRADAEAVDIKLMTAEVELAVAKRKSSRFGGSVGCGPAVVFDVEGGTLNLDGAIACGMVWGIRF